MPQPWHRRLQFLPYRRHRSGQPALALLLVTAGAFLVIISLPRWFWTAVLGGVACWWGWRLLQDRN
ncbi:MAG: hypothetical protein WD535_00615 [Thermaerobacterales bacterium]